MLKASYQKYRLFFKEPSGTSRGILTEKLTYFVKVWEDSRPEKIGIGECALFKGLSAEDRPDYEEKLRSVCRDIDHIETSALEGWSSIRLGIEMAMADLRQGGRRIYFPSPFTEGEKKIEINGLIWMGDRATMLRRIQEKIEAGFHCIKLKIGAIDFEAELSLLHYIRERFGPEEVELRVDANGAFTPAEALERLQVLASFGLHSIEQPIRRGQWEEMARLCAVSPLPIALDEELIGVEGSRKKVLLDTIRPSYLVIKPALCGGFQGAEEWIGLAAERGIGWWITSALESNVGLSALAQWVATLGNTMPQGLGTGRLYTNNTPSALCQEGKYLFMQPDFYWDLTGAI